MIVTQAALRWVNRPAIGSDRRTAGIGLPPLVCQDAPSIVIIQPANPGSSSLQINHQLSVLAPLTWAKSAGSAIFH